MHSLVLFDSPSHWAPQYEGGGLLHDLDLHEIIYHNCILCLFVCLSVYGSVSLSTTSTIFYLSVYQLQSPMLVYQQSPRPGLSLCLSVMLAYQQSSVCPSVIVTILIKLSKLIKTAIGTPHHTLSVLHHHKRQNKKTNETKDPSYRQLVHTQTFYQTDS